MPHSWLATTTTEATRYNEKILHFHINALEKKGEGEREKSYADKMENFSVHIKKLQPEKNAEWWAGGGMRKIHT